MNEAYLNIQKAIKISYKNRKYYRPDHPDRESDFYRYAYSYPVRYNNTTIAIGVDKWRRKGEKEESTITITYYYDDGDNDYTTIKKDSPFTYEKFIKRIREDEPEQDEPEQPNNA